MTDWNDQIQTYGSGFVAYRLMVEGWPHEWVTDPRITHNVGLGDRLVYPGLSYEGLRIDERMVLREAWPECTGMTVTIVPTDANEDTLNSFTRDPRLIATLDGSIEAGDTTWATTPGLGVGVAHLGSEAVFVAIDGVTITRGYWDSEAQDHTTTEGSVEVPVSIYNWPPTMEGRRAFLYAYGPNDDPDSDGQNIWRGIVKRPPAMDSDGVSWKIEIGPIIDAFDQTVGTADEIEYRIRGVYHSSSCPMKIGLVTTFGGATEMPQTVVKGFYENEDLFAQAVTDAFAANLASATGNAADIVSMTMSYSRVEGRYSMYFDTGGGHSDYPLRVAVYDALDGSMLDNGGPGDPNANGAPPYSGLVLVWAGNANGEWYFMNGSPQEKAPYAYPLPPARTLVGSPLYDEKYPTLLRFIDSYKVDDDTTPDNRVYLVSVDGLEIGDVLCVKNGEVSSLMRITDLDADQSERWIEVELLDAGQRGLYITSESTIVPIRVYNENGNWADFIEAIIDAAPAANLGKTPWITDRDVDTSAWAGYWEDYPFYDYWRHRSYRFGKQVRVRDVFAPELQMTGWMARMTLDGRLDVAPMPFISAQRSASRSLTDNDILLPSDELVGMWPTWVAQADGLVNLAKVRLGYNPIEDDFDPSGDYTIRVTQSIAEHKSGDRASAEIEVRSESASYVKPMTFFGATFNVNLKNTITALDVSNMVMPYLRATSTDYATVTVAVPFSYFTVLVGDIVSVTSAYLPDGLGNRGVVNKKAIVVGRAWNLDPASDDMGVLTLWFARDSGRVSGYAPTGRIGSKTDLGSNSWNLTFNPASSRNIAWAESSDGLVLQHFAAGDTVQIVEVDTLTPTVAYGTITSIVDDTHCIVQLEDVWTPGSSTWNMRFYYDNDESVTLVATERQASYCWIADADKEYLNNDYANFPTAREAV